MQPFTVLTAVGVPFDQVNLDTDQIIPARFLRKLRSDGYHNFLFYDLRLKEDGSENPDFILNKPPYRGAQIAVGNDNFGCGSSREGAVWALKGFGFRAYIAPSFGDILASNSLKNGVLPVVLRPEEAATLRRQMHETPGAKITISLETQTVTGPDGAIYRFETDPFRRQCLLLGQDEIALTLRHEADISAFEQRYGDELPHMQPPLSPA